MTNEEKIISIDFIIRDGKISFRVNTEQDSVSHRTWAQSMGIGKYEFYRLVRGTCLKTEEGYQAIFYKGSCEFDDECAQAARRFAPQVKEYLKTETLHARCGRQSFVVNNMEVGTQL